METKQIHHTTLDILLVEQPESQSKKDEAFLAAALGAGAVSPPASGSSAHQLALGYRVALARADEKRLESIAFSGIDTHTCGCPLDEAAGVAIRAVQEYLNAHPRTTLKRILFVQYSREAYDAFCAALKNLTEPTT